MSGCFNSSPQSQKTGLAHDVKVAGAEANKRHMTTIHNKKTIPHPMEIAHTHSTHSFVLFGVWSRAHTRVASGANAG